MAGLLSKIFKEGELPTVTTEVTFNKQSLFLLAVVVIVVFITIALINKAIKKA